MSDVGGYFGLCPECHQTGGYRNVGSSHWFFCEAHKLRWCAGSNLFSGWRAETEAEQRAAWSRVANFKDITGHEYHPPYGDVVTSTTTH